jgi:predicted enzyme involved in methoxymalonyl-ACP biosynthesis
MLSADYDLLIASLEDKFGTYGKIGLCLIEKSADHWTVKLLLMSCRVMSRGVGTILMNHVIAQAKAAGVRLRAEFVRTDRNRLMYVTYRFSNFRVISQSGDLVVFENDCSTVAGFPAYAKVNIVGRSAPQLRSGQAHLA